MFCKQSPCFINKTCGGVKQKQLWRLCLFQWDTSMPWKWTNVLFSSYIYYHRYVIKQLLHYIWILFTHIYLRTKQILVNKIQYSDQLYIILVITLSYLQIPLKTSLISIRSEYLNTSIKHWWTLNMVKTWVAKNCIESHYLLLKQHPCLVCISWFYHTYSMVQIFPDLCVLQNVFKIILLFTRIYMILRVVCKSRRYWNVVDMRYKIRRFQRTGGMDFTDGGYWFIPPVRRLWQLWREIRDHTTLVINQSYCRIYASCGITMITLFPLYDCILFIDEQWSY